MAAVRARVPARITFEAAFLALLGIAFPTLFGIAVAVAGVAFILIVKLFAIFLLKVLWLLVFPLFAALRGLWSARAAPEYGEELVAAQSPELFATIERLRTAAKAGRIHGVYLTGDLNAAMVQTPRRGLFGGLRNQLWLGLPLMATMDEAHFTAALAHEIGHLARRHGSFHARIYALRQTLDIMVEDLAEHGSWLVFPIVAFYRVFTPRFDRVTLELSRAVEYEADAEAADAVGAQTAAESLVVLHGIASYSEAEVWPQIFKRANDEAEPPADVYASFTEFVRRPIVDVHRFVSEALGQQTSPGDTHPALVDRLRNLGFAPADLEHALDGYALRGPSAADVFLGGAAEQRRAVAAAWRDTVRPHWLEAHTQAVALRTQFDELDALGDAADVDQRRARALAAARLGRSDAGDLLSAAAASAPDDAELAFRAGEVLAGRDDERGVALLERAMRLDPFATFGAAAAARAFYLRRADRERAAAFETRLRDFNVELQLAAEERRVFTGNEPIAPHGLSNDELAPVRHAVDLPDIEGVYLARRRLAHLPARPHFVLGVQRRKTKYGSSDDNIATVVKSDLTSFPHAVSVIVSTRAAHPAIAALRDCDGTAVAL
ncbi:MAG TPA: M48 family metallopeptidase [Candidatus Elarobacter sp.]|nr:M48 family metallopeptidase [Candidatus Elarobacter sp.]